MNNNILEALPAGTQLQGGKYTIRQAIGQGATGITYVASMRQTLEGNLASFEQSIDVAVKEFFMKSDCQREQQTTGVVVPNIKSTQQVEQYKSSFIREAKKISGLSHTNIVHVLSVFEENNTVYYVMQFIGGGSIKDYIDHRGAMPEQEALRYTMQIASALDYMHTQKHMCHYDLKPANIMLTGRGDAMLIDFGIAKNYDENGQQTSTTPPGLTKGFAPLEQYSSLYDFSPKSDVYSLGATLYAMLTGQVPPEPMVWVGGKPFTPKPANVSDRTWALVRRAMAVSSNERPTMAQFIGMMEGKLPVNYTEKSENTVYGEDTTYRDDASQKEKTLTYEELVRQKQQKQEQQSQNGYDFLDPPVDPVPAPRTDPLPKPKPKSRVLVTVICVVVGLVVAFGAAFFFLKNGKTGKEEVVNTDTVTEKPIYASDGRIIMKFKGEVVNGMPQGRGVVTYIDDVDGRTRYEGAYLNGMREDSAAVLYYKNGDIYRGSFIANKFGTGTYFIKENGMFFRGTFKDDQPYNGVWYNADESVQSRIRNGNVE